MLALSIANFIIKNELLDKDYVKKHTTGFSKFCEKVKAFDTGKASNITGVSKSEIEDFARLISKRVVGIRTGVALERNLNEVTQ